MKKKHDHSYKLLFSHPRMVADLLKGFVKESWVKKIDFDTLERCNGSYVSDDLREREDDMVWRMRYGKEWVYLYLLLEFQSTVDDFMAVRIMGYKAPVNLLEVRTMLAERLKMRDKKLVQKGLEQGHAEIVRNMSKNGLEPKEICNLTSLSLVEVKKLLKANG